ncbi:phytanoyl-CoA dioxygenase family protein [Dyadobacter sp. NIV53]|uniref:phytanoyl-CoA dioxygenase family protein n=1 Tax=Dyadobacter sp. NIV53 TaxID=2861765 RepID=UPI001C88BF70|nr:phytanoyl-CoA dioxygenase family protein [Dyadobacter sp. NIV53]
MTFDVKESISKEGFAIVEQIFSGSEVDKIISTISGSDTNKSTFRKTEDLFAIRQFLKEIPDSVKQIFSDKFIQILEDNFGKDFFVVKSIYFDKPGESNWFVPYHQDLTISVDKKINLPGFGPWTTKQNQFAVQPPLEILEDNFTARIHLDDTNEENGALKIIPKSHLKGVYRAETIDWNVENEISCNVGKGGVMFMKPLLLHASSRTTNYMKRRVIHIEFSRRTLPENLNWSEYLWVNMKQFNL